MYQMARTFVLGQFNYLRFREGKEPYQVNQNSDTPRIIYGDQRNSWDADRFLENGSYFRLKIFLSDTILKGMVEEFGY